MIPHGILKNAPSNTPAARSQEDRNRETALYHANLIQQRKDIEAQILASTETLLDVPTSPSADPARPSPQDAALIKNSLRPFQPSDYDALIEERNINKTCGYVLCPRPNRQENTDARYRILFGKGKGADAMRVVEKSFLEKWCSDDCGRMALYVKVQLNEEPAWTRSAAAVGNIMLLDDKPTSEVQMLEGMKNLDIAIKEEDVVAQMKALAIERGDGNAPSRSFGLAEVGVKENVNLDKGAPPPKALTNEAKLAMAVEDYQPRAMPGYAERSESASEDEDDEDIIETI